MAPDPAYIAQPSGPCCITGHIHTGTPRGAFETIADIKTYIARPASSHPNGNILLYFPDVWGHFTNTFLVADTFADAGYLVLVPDYFNDDAVWTHFRDRKDMSTAEPDFDFEAWKTKHIAFADEHVPLWTRAVKSIHGGPSTRYACVGYCFGAPYVCDALASSEGSQPVCSVGAFAHPAFLKDRHFQRLTRPLFLSCAETDHTFGTDARGRAVDIMAQAGKDYHLQLFSGVKHGFALKGDPDKPYDRFVKEQSAKGIVDWFDFWLDVAGLDKGEGGKA